jgi:CHAD domain-containing protein
MTQQETIHTLKSHFEKIQASFDAAIAYLDAEDIHAFRVEVKKLRAFLHLGSSGAKAKPPGRLHLFYRMVGEIRNLQLQEQRIREACLYQSCLPHTYLNLLAIETAAAIRRARQFATSRLSIPVEERQVLSALTYPTKDNLQGFVRKALYRLQKISDNHHPIDDDALHSLRKCLKDLPYNHPYTALTDLLGQFQDLRSGLVFLQPIYIDQIPDAGEKKMLERIRVLWEKDKAAIKNQVLSMKGICYVGFANGKQ